jgi:hypothetical protein
LYPSGYLAKAADYRCWIAYICIFINSVVQMKNSSKEKIEMKSLGSVLASNKVSEYSTQFKITDQGLISLETQKIYQPDQVRVVHFYRYEGESDPDDNAILYAIETNEGEKGTIVDAYGMYSDPLVSNFMKQVEEISK